MCAQIHLPAEFGHTPIDRAIAELAVIQHGVVSRDQLSALGLSRGAIDARRGRGLLHDRHHGVYAVGYARIPWRGQLWAAALAKPAAVISHRSGGAVHELMSPRLPIEMTTTGSAKSVPGILVHRSRTLEPRDITTHEGLPVTTPSRTILDLLDVLPSDRVANVLKRAELQGILNLADLTTSPPGRRSRALRRALEELRDTGPQLTRSELEQRFLAIVRRARLPLPLVNHPVDGYVADFLWPARRLIAETDGAASHLTPRAFEDDRRRDARLLLAGYRVVRFTHLQVTEQPDEVTSTLAALLTLDSGSPGWGSRAVKGDGL